ncbi:MAG TPA: NAD(P)/FAD-dependent oxidoreductase [Bacillota bacterium]|nr:NAD(P)/FAD-dependent oxidoreductase [Bacillota bacterium]
MINDVIVVGGGPSGLMAAITAAEQGANVALIEKGNKLGTKLAISGGGRCNVTNRLSKEEIIKHIPGNGKFLYSAFSVFDNYDIINFFENMGVALKEEDHGRMFPASDSAQSVVQTLVNRLKELNVNIMLNTPVKAVHYDQDYHTVLIDENEYVKAKSLIIAVGGMSVPHTGSTGDGYAWAKKAGHTITELYPTEVALTSNETFIKEKTLQGLSLRDISLSVLNKHKKAIITHRMDMVFTHFGISGPAVLRCSQFVVKKLLKGYKAVTMSLDLLPDKNIDEVEATIKNLVNDYPQRSIKNALKGIIPERLFLFLLQKNNLDESMKCGNVSNEHIRELVKDIKQFTFTVNGSLSIEKAFVTGGGVSTNEIIPNTMESKLTERLFFCGEIIDVHGYTGGYNITSALITGHTAGLNASYYKY